ncbi:unnamed protein product [Citrullus colocynthis]|uniref:Uncharacterized protein n=1 Tax=Citrullus colocynthis TaxID=252529 RepID=A0ABP0Y9P2_9ROSI
MLDKEIKNLESLDSSLNLLGMNFQIIHMDATCRDGNNITRYGALIGSMEGSIGEAMHGFTKLNLSPASVETLALYMRDFGQQRGFLEYYYS